MMEGMTGWPTVRKALETAFSQIHQRYLGKNMEKRQDLQRMPGQSASSIHCWHPACCSYCSSSRFSRQCDHSGCRMTRMTHGKHIRDLLVDAVVLFFQSKVDIRKVSLILQWKHHHTAIKCLQVLADSLAQHVHKEPAWLVEYPGILPWSNWREVSFLLPKFGPKFWKKWSDLNMKLWFDYISGVLYDQITWGIMFWSYQFIPFPLPSDHLTVCHGKSPCIFKFGKPSISIRAIEKPWRTVSHNQRVNTSNDSHFPIKHGDFPIKNGDFPVENGDLCISTCHFKICSGYSPGQLALAGSLPLAYIALGWCLCLLAAWTHLKIALIYKHHYIYYTSTYVYIWLHMYFF